MRIAPFLPRTVLILCLVIAACGEGTGPEPDEITGSWEGFLEPAQNSTVFLVTIDIVDRDGAVDGRGEIRLSGTSLPLEVDGRYTRPGVDLTLDPDGPLDPVFFTGTAVAADTLRGTVSGSGFEQESLELVRRR